MNEKPIRLFYCIWPFTNSKPCNISFDLQDISGIYKPLHQEKLCTSMLSLDNVYTPCGLYRLQLDPLAHDSIGYTYLPFIIEGDRPGAGWLWETLYPGS